MTNTALLTAGLLAAAAATAAAAPPIPGPQDGYQYAAKFVCGVQEDPKLMILARGFYATTINVHNPNPQTVQFRKRLALSIPPGGTDAYNANPRYETPAAHAERLRTPSTGERS